jgi:hypothetical protein
MLAKASTTKVDKLQDLLLRKRALYADVTPELATRLRQLRSWQAARLAQTYEDLKEQPRYAAAVAFLSDDLYGPEDPTRRDIQVERAWRYFKRVLPRSTLRVMESAMQLDLLTTELDQKMAQMLGMSGLSASTYAAAYRKVGRIRDRRRQIALTIAVGEALDRVVGRSWVSAALHAAHVPAHAAGLGILQNFLQSGFSAFRRMHGAQELLSAIRRRETQLLQTLMRGGH